MKQPKKPRKTAPKIDSPMTPAEKDSFVEQVEEFEGPDRREKRGSEKPEPHEPGVARS